MEEKVTASVKEASPTLYRLWLHLANAPVDAETFDDDDERRFREKGLDIQDFTPSYIDVYQYATRKQDAEGALQNHTLEPDFQVFVYSFSYLPDPTWLVNWENGANMEDWCADSMVRLHDRSKRQFVNLEIASMIF